MGGGKSSSSTSSSQETYTQTTSTSSTATGIVGDLFQGQTISITENLPENAVEVFKSLVALSSGAIDIAAQAGGRALDTAEKASQPDLSALETVQETSNKQLRYIVIGAVIISAALLFARK